MIIIGIILSVVALGFLCGLLFMLAVHALPFLAGATAALCAYHTGSGPIGAVVVGAIVALVTLVGGQIAVAAVRSSLIRAAIVLLFAVPAAIAAYHATLGLAQIGVPAQGWQEAFALIGAIIVGGAAWTRMTPSAPAGGGQGVTPGSAQLSSGVGNQRPVRVSPSCHLGCARRAEVASRSVIARDCDSFTAVDTALR